MRKERSSIYINLGKMVINELEERNDKYALYKVIKYMIRYAKKSKINYIIPKIDFLEYEERNISLVVKDYNKKNKGLRFTENCIISNKCDKKCYRYNICKEDYEKRTGK